MAAPQWTQQFAYMVKGALENLSGATVLRALRESGLGIRTQEFYRTWGTARRLAAETGLEPTRPVDQAPTLQEATPVATRGAEGFLHTTRLVYRERVTGKQRVVYHNVKSPVLLTRQEAINQAIDAYAAHSEEYETDLVAAVHSSVIHLVPVDTGP